MSEHDDDASDKDGSTGGASCSPMPHPRSRGHDEDGPSSVGAGIGRGRTKSLTPNSSSSSSSSSKKQTDVDAARINRVRLALGAIFVLAGAVCTGTYFFVNAETKNDFRLSFDLFVDAIQNGLSREADNLHDGLRNLGDTIVDSSSASSSRNHTPASLSSSSSFPFVLVDQWETHGDHARDRTMMEAILYAPLVRNEPHSRKEWQDFSRAHQDWIATARQKFISHETAKRNDEETSLPVYLDGDISPYIYTRRDEIFPEPVMAYTDENDASSSSSSSSSSSLCAPLWYLSPPPFNPAVVNLDLLQQPAYATLLQYVMEQQEQQELQQSVGAIKMHRATGFSPVLDSIEPYAGLQITDADHLAFHQKFMYNNGDNGDDGDDVSIIASNGYLQPHSLYATTVVHQNTIVGVLLGFVAWDAFLANLLPQGVQGIHVVLKPHCQSTNGKEEDEESVSQSFTYELNGRVPYFIGKGDLHDKSFDYMKRDVPFVSLDRSYAGEGDDGQDTLCTYMFRIYPTETFKDQYDSNRPLIAAVSLGGTFMLIALVFFFYDSVVQRRNRRVTAVAEKTTAVVNSLFPEAVRDRLLAANEETPTVGNGKGKKKDGFDRTANDSGASASGAGRAIVGRPIADHFNESTIMFADIRGFTAWSSSRQPVQVFELLETLYSAFDGIAKRRRVFKVETIGDCYVAVCGVPDRNKDHAVVMAKFAKDCLRTFQALVLELESSLGPDTADLGLRAGLHSGPVTGGVLRGDRARFQLFGDSMNTASRIETNGMANKIHCSQETADLLIAAGKQGWVIPREDKIVAKGKGELQTYWIEVKRNSDVSSLSSGDSSHGSDTEEHQREHETDEKKERLVDYNVAILQQFLKRIVASRQNTPEDCQNAYFRGACGNPVPFEELADVIDFPIVHSMPLSDCKDVELDSKVVDQLESYVSSVAAMHRGNHFHNFEHASHMTMSVAKHLSKFTRSSSNAGDNASFSEEDMMYKRTHGLSSDPLAQLAIVMSGLIHDADHRGVSNAQLMKENLTLAAAYKDRCVAEQNSFDLCWNLLMHKDYEKLRETICQTNDELQVFRQVMINAVLATDLSDPDLNSLRKERWEKAFGGEAANTQGADIAIASATNRKATVVIELLSQAATMAYTMQHWHVYRKWSQRLFLEQHAAYSAGRCDTNPAETWYQSQLNLLDEIAMPVAQRLKDSNVLGLSGDECLRYATQNRKQWESMGMSVTEEFKELVAKK